MRNSAGLLFAALLFLGMSNVFSQLAADDPDWKEIDAPAPPEFDRKRLVAVDMPVGGELKFGVDPTTITIGKDGVVRYVLVASSASGNFNAMYEAIRCATGEFKTYARRSADSPWAIVLQPNWRSMQDNQPSRHAWKLAKQGVCTGRAPASSATEIVQNLKSPKTDTR
jgi:hypothetical protein